MIVSRLLMATSGKFFKVEAHFPINEKGRQGVGMVHGWNHSGVSTTVLRRIRGRAGISIKRKERLYLSEGSWYVYRNEHGGSDLPEVAYQIWYVQPYPGDEYGAVV